MLPRIIAEIAQNQGWISSARYMDLALHAPGGYYAAANNKFGAEGDFVTAPELGKLFGRTLSRQLKELLDENGRILEIGAGSGALAETLLDELRCEYFILETSADLRDRQRGRLGGRASWLDSLPQSFRGVIVANEVVDAMPVHAVAWQAQGIRGGGVAAGAGGFLWRDRPAPGALLEEGKKIPPPLPYEREIGLAGQAWMRPLAERLEGGAIFATA